MAIDPLSEMRSISNLSGISQLRDLHRRRIPKSPQLNQRPIVRTPHHQTRPQLPEYPWTSERRSCGRPHDNESGLLVSLGKLRDSRRD